MKVNELMIDDWYCWESEGKQYYFQMTKEDFARPEYDIANYQPIHITRDILINNGFEMIRDGKYPSLRNHYMDIIFQLEEANGSDYNKPFYTFRGIPVFHVHDLQHLLKSCRINKKITKII